MVATIFMMATKYACNDNNNWDLIWMQSRFQRRLNMLAISNSYRTIYGCNLFRNGVNMLAIIENLFLRDSSKNHRLWFIVTWLQDEFIASIFVPCHENYCNDMWSIPICWLHHQLHARFTYKMFPVITTKS